MVGGGRRLGLGDTVGNVFHRGRLYTGKKPRGVESKGEKKKAVSPISGGGGKKNNCIHPFGTPAKKGPKKGTRSGKKRKKKGTTILKETKNHIKAENCQ